MTPLLHTYAEAAELLTVSQRTVRRLVEDGHLDVVYVTERNPRITAVSINRHISSHAQVPAPRDAEDDK